MTGTIGRFRVVENARVTEWYVDASVRVLCVCGTLTSFLSKVPPHTSLFQLVLLATPFTPVVVEAPKLLEDITAIPGPATSVRKSTVPPSLGTPLEEPFISNLLSILYESQRYRLRSRSTRSPRVLLVLEGRRDIVNTGIKICLRDTHQARKQIDI